MGLSWCAALARQSNFYMHRYVYNRTIVPDPRRAAGLPRPAPRRSRSGPIWPVGMTMQGFRILIENHGLNR
eukprot:SAG22_NODE_2956_length_2078_cov_1.551794_3_plen_70_part_01